jgi:hypothetical protein
MFRRSALTNEWPKPAIPNQFLQTMLMAENLLAWQKMLANNTRPKDRRALAWA